LSENKTGAQTEIKELRERIELTELRARDVEAQARLLEARLRLGEAQLKLRSQRSQTHGE
jgi:hypothetical protein